MQYLCYLRGSGLSFVRQQESLIEGGPVAA
jgi:hypothetical protein